MATQSRIENKKGEWIEPFACTVARGKTRSVIMPRLKQKLALYESPSEQLGTNQEPSSTFTKREKVVPQSAKSRARQTEWVGAKAVFVL